MRSTPYSLIPEIKWRMELFHEGGYVRKWRQVSTMPPGGPRAHALASAYLYVCPITKDYVVTTKVDVCPDSSRRLVCYHTFRSRAAAVMYANAVGG